MEKVLRGLTVLTRPTVPLYEGVVSPERGHPMKVRRREQYRSKELPPKSSQHETTVNRVTDLTWSPRSLFTQVTYLVVLTFPLRFLRYGPSWIYFPGVEVCDPNLVGSPRRLYGQFRCTYSPCHTLCTPPTYTDLVRVRQSLHR